MRMLRGKAAETYVTKLEGRGSRLDEVEPAVRRIVNDVRKNGDRALLKLNKRTARDFGFRIAQPAPFASACLFLDTAIA